ncbi:hypothetical protein NSS71_11170 [Niallia sp. FSL W8-0951]|uniref:hypothetical protein n=1 Tax=Niallia sp. FSL W8-0951 TaxID=2954639 RepID=UPI0030FAF84F
MSIPIFEIYDVLYKWATNEPSIDEFTVENILNAVGLDYSFYEEIYRYLMSKSGYELIPKKIVLCPDNHKCDTFLLEEPIEGELFDCFCGQNEFEAHNLLLVFSFTDDFIENAIKKKGNFKTRVKTRELILT